MYFRAVIGTLGKRVSHIFERKGSETIWKTKNSSYSVQIGKTTFIVCVKQSETAKKPIEKVFKDICRHEVQEDFFSAGLLSLEKLKKSS